MSKENDLIDKGLPYKGTLCHTLYQMTKCETIEKEKQWHVLVRKGLPKQIIFGINTIDRN